MKKLSILDVVFGENSKNLGWSKECSVNWGIFRPVDFFQSAMNRHQDGKDLSFIIYYLLSFILFMYHYGILPVA